MKRFVLLFSFLVVSLFTFGQNRRIISEDSTITVDGVELGYIITDETSKSAGKEEFARFKITFYANNGGCARAYRLRESGSDGSISTEGQTGSTVASFYVRNANGKRMTSRDLKLNAGEWWVPVKVREKNAEGKEETRVREMMAGYIFRLGDHLEGSIIVLVPQGERPMVEAILHRSSDL